MYRPIRPMLALPMLAGLLTLACGTAQAVTCQNNLPPSNPDIVYANNGDTVSDLRNGLMWKKCVEGESGSSCTTGTATTMSWAAAQSAAQSSTFSGYSDWRVPNVRELQSLVEVCRSSPAINDAVFPNDPSSNVWSGSPYADDSSDAWNVYFLNGDVYNGNRALGAHVRLVRGGQSFGDLIFRNGFDGGG